MPAGKSSSSLVGLIDVYPTLGELTGAKVPEHVQGKSLVPVLKDEKAKVNDHVLTVAISRARWVNKKFTKKQVKGYTIRTSRHRYTQWNAGKYGHELYDYEVDSGEITKLADDPEHLSLIHI